MGFKARWDRMMVRILAVVLSCAAFSIPFAASAADEPFPIKSPEDAISVAKAVCIAYGKPLSDEDQNQTTIKDAMTSLQWNAKLEGNLWHVDTTPSIVAGTNDHLLIVDIPVNGPAPKQCTQSLYTFFNLPPRKPKSCENSEPTDLSEANAVNLAFEAYMRGQWTGGIMAPPGQSEPDDWLVSIRVAGPPNSDTQELGLYKIFKRTGNVLNVKTGEQFNSLPSKSHFLELHCLTTPDAK